MRLSELSICRTQISEPQMQPTSQTRSSLTGLQLLITSLTSAALGSGEDKIQTHDSPLQCSSSTHSVAHHSDIRSGSISEVELRSSQSLRLQQQEP